MTAPSSSIAILLGTMAVLALIEAGIPLRALRPWKRLHRLPNLALTLITFAISLMLGGAMILGLSWLEMERLGALNAIDIPLFWSIAYTFVAMVAGPLGVSPGACAIYRLLPALNALPEHANIRVPAWLDRILSLITTWPHMHKVHHSSTQQETDSNYGNLFSIWDRLFLTFTPSYRGISVNYGLEGESERHKQTLSALLIAPFRSRDAARACPVRRQPSHRKLREDEC